MKEHLQRLILAKSADVHMCVQFEGMLQTDLDGLVVDHGLFDIFE